MREIQRICAERFERADPKAAAAALTDDEAIAARRRIPASFAASQVQALVNARDQECRSLEMVRRGFFPLFPGAPIDARARAFWATVSPEARAAVLAALDPNAQSDVLKRILGGGGDKQ